MGYYSGLDGIRALAIVAVLLYHGGVVWANGGFLGVEAFFVLSGFLITWLLIAEWRGSGNLLVLHRHDVPGDRRQPARLAEHRAHATGVVALHLTGAGRRDLAGHARRGVIT
jgi:hypothetical protein